MKEALEKLVANIEGLHRQLCWLRDDLEYQHQGGKIYYAVDFCEVHSFLNETWDSSQTAQDLLWTGNEESAARQHYLSLTHLFRSFADKVYLLPPHCQEMWSYVRRETGYLQHGPLLFQKARDAVSKLSDEQREILRSLESNVSLTPAQANTLIDLVKHDFENLCTEVSEFLNRVAFDTRIKRLSSLIKSQMVSYDYERLCSDLAILPTGPSFDTQEFTTMAQMFPRAELDDSWFAKILDSHALVYLREINKSLRKKHAHAKLLFVSRDAGIREVVAKLQRADCFSWPEATGYFRNVGTMLLDLLLRGAKTYPEKIKVIRDTDSLLTQMKDSISRLQLHKSEDWPAWRSSTERQITNIPRHWDDHINLRLSLAVPEVKWLPSNVTNRRSIERGDHIESNDKLALLMNLWRFVSRREYVEMATRTVASVWEMLWADAMRTLFIGRLNDISVDALCAFFTTQSENDAGRLLKNQGRLTTHASIEFTKNEYRSLLRKISEQPDAELRLTEIKTAFLSAVSSATSGPGDPEDFLFMAYMLGILDQPDPKVQLDRWKDAVGLAEESLVRAKRRTGSKTKSEILYFLGLAHRRMVQLECEDPLDHLVKAFAFIKKAMPQATGPVIEVKNSADPRFLKEMASIVLQYHRLPDHIRAGPPGTKMGEKLARMSKAKGIVLLKQALEASECGSWLQIEILNKLACAAIEQDGVTFIEAQNYVKQLEEELAYQERIPNSSNMPQPWIAALKDTIIMVKAIPARQKGDVKGLIECIEDLNEILAEQDLAEGPRRVLTENKQKIEGWLATLGTTEKTRPNRPSP